MADTVLAVNENGSIFQRPDGTRYYLGAFGFPLIDCDPPAANPCTNFVPLALPTLDPRASSAIITERTRLLDEALSDEALAALSVGGISPTVYEASNVAAYLPGGLPQLLTFVPEIARTIAAETKAYVEAKYASGDPYALTSPGERLTGFSTLKAYENALASSTNPAVQQLVATERATAMGILDELGITGFSSSGSFTPFYSPPTFPNVITVPNFNPGSIDAGSPPIATTSGGVLGTIDQIGGTLINILGGLSRAGVIRGSVGEFFTGGNQSPSAGVSPANVSAMNLAPGGQMPSILESLLQQLNFSTGNSVGDGSMTGTMLSGLENLLGVNQGGCNRSVRLNAMQAMPLFKQGCNRAFIPRRIFVDGPDGTPYVLYNAGQASIGSREQSVARSIARRSGFKLVRRGSGGGSRRRRPR
jgi:hypothetical protein